MCLGRVFWCRACLGKSVGVGCVEVECVGVECVG